MDARHSSADGNPLTLFQLSARVIAKFPDLIADLINADPALPTHAYRLREDVALPMNVSLELLTAFKHEQRVAGMDARHLNIFIKAVATPLHSLDLSKTRVGDLMFGWLLLSHGSKIECMNLRDCDELTAAKMPAIPLPNLKVLNMGSLLQIFGDWAPQAGMADENMQSNDSAVNFLPSSSVSIASVADESTMDTDDSRDGLTTTSTVGTEEAAATPRLSGQMRDFPFEHLELLAGGSGSNANNSSTRCLDGGSDDGSVTPPEPKRKQSPNDNDGSALDDGYYDALSDAMQEGGEDGYESDDEAPEADKPRRKVSVFAAPFELVHLRSSVAAEQAQNAEAVFQMSLKRRGFNENFQPSTSTAASSKESTEPILMIPKYHMTRLCPELLSLVFHGTTYDEVFPDVVDQEDGIVEPPAGADLLAEFLAPLTRLLFLDISNWPHLEDLRFLRPNLVNTLETLILYNVPELHVAVDTICEAKNLRTLDISQSHVDMGTYDNPVTTLDRIVRSLPKLESLDISYTNLASNPSEGDWPPKIEPTVQSDIVGLRGLSAPLKFLGLFQCDGAPHYRHIPAEQVTGDASEQQILLAIERYISRPALLHRVLNEAYQVYRNGEPHFHAKALELVASTMELHISDSNIQICCSAAVFYIVKNIEMGYAMKRRLVENFLTAMEEHSDEQILVRNCCLSLCHFDVPSDLLFDYQRAVTALLRALRDHVTDATTQRIVVFLLNSMACHVEGEQKLQVGNLGAIEQLCGVVQQRLTDHECDEVMEVSWSFLWNITDETPSNCERFLASNGLQLFKQCYEAFPDEKKLFRNMMGSLVFQEEKIELIRNMMGLMVRSLQDVSVIGNIAEVKELRPRLLQKDYVDIFVKLLENTSDGIEIPYNSSGVLAHLLSDGPTAWTPIDPSREAVSNAVVKAIGTWKLDARRFINYRSFAPILRLVNLRDCVASQHWAIWAMANLTTVDGKYCGFVRDEGGMELLNEQLANQDTNVEIKRLVSIILCNVAEWIAKQQRKGGANEAVVAAGLVVEEQENIADEPQS